jgi:hypothetical protein
LCSGSKVERLAVEGIGLLVVAGLAQGKAHQVVHVGMLIDRQQRRELDERTLVVHGLELGAHRREVRRILRGDVVDGERAGGAERRAGERGQDQEHGSVHGSHPFDYAAPLSLHAVFIRLSA